MQVHPNMMRARDHATKHDIKPMTTRRFFAAADPLAPAANTTLPASSQQPTPSIQLEALGKSLNGSAMCVSTIRVNFLVFCCIC
jgi:hypothetical protein